MKIFYRGIFALLVSIVMVACSKDNAANEIQENSGANINMPTSNKAQSINYYEATKILTEEFGQNVPKLPLTQADVDYYAGLVHYEGQLQAAQANEVADHVAYAQEVGVRKYMDERMDYEEFTKETVLLIMGNNGPIENIEASSEFRNLPKNEQKVILEVNKIARDYSEIMRSSNNRTVSCSANGQPAPCSFVGAAIGFMAGNGLCGIPCGVGGAILGGIIGWAIGGGGK